MSPKPWYQRAFILMLWVTAGILAFGTVLDAISNAISIITPQVTYIGTVTVLGILLLLLVSLWISPLPWVANNGQRVRLRSIGLQPILGVIGVLILLWIPRLGDFYNIEKEQSPISIHYWMGINGYPTLTLPFLSQQNDNSLIVQLLSEFFQTDKPPFIYSNNPVFRSLEKFSKESGNDDTIASLNQQSGYISYYLANQGNLQEKNKILSPIDNIDPTIEDANSTLIETNAPIYEGEDNNFQFASIMMPFRATSENAKYTFILDDSYDEDSPNKVGQIVQFPKMSEIQKLAVEDDWYITSSNNEGLRNTWINKVVENNPDIRGFFSFLYFFSDNIKELARAIEKMGCRGVYVPRSLIVRYMPSPYVVFIDVENTSQKAVQINSINFGLLEKGAYELTPFEKRSALLKDLPEESQTLDISLQPAQHLFIPLEFGFDTISQREKFETLDDPDSTNSETDFPDLKKVVYMGNPANRNEYLKMGCDNENLLDSEKIKCTETLTSPIQIERSFSVILEKKENVLNAISPKFAVGSVMSVTSIQANGKKTNVRLPKDESEVFTKISQGLEPIRALSCPHLLAYIPAQKAWLYMGTIIAGRSSKSLKGDDIYNIDINTSKLKIEEREKEISYIDSVSILYTEANTGLRQKVRPNVVELLENDGNYLTLFQGDYLEINLEELVPPNAEKVKLKVNGYYKEVH